MKLGGLGPVAPFAPHLSEEVWVEILGKPFSVHTSKWPKFDNSKIQKDALSIIVQVNGKLRGQLAINNSQLAGEKEKIEKLAKEDEKIAKWLEGKNIKKTIFVPGKLINFVV